MYAIYIICIANYLNQSQGGLAPGGLNFDAKVRRDSTDLRDLFIGHIAAMDTFARGLKIAARIVDDGLLKKAVEVRHYCQLNKSSNCSNIECSYTMYVHVAAMASVK